MLCPPTELVNKTASTRRESWALNQMKGVKLMPRKCRNWRRDAIHPCLFCKHINHCQHLLLNASLGIYDSVYTVTSNPQRPAFMEMEILLLRANSYSDEIMRTRVPKKMNVCFVSARMRERFPLEQRLQFC